MRFESAFDQRSAEPTTFRRVDPGATALLPRQKKIAAAVRLHLPADGQSSLRYGQHAVLARIGRELMQHQGKMCRGLRVEHERRTRRGDAGVMRVPSSTWARTRSMISATRRLACVSRS